MQEILQREGYFVKEAFRLGADDFITKPFNKGQILKVVKSLLVPPVENALNEAAVTNYCQVNIDKFSCGETLQHSLFVQLSETKFVKIAFKGQILDPERVLVYKKKGVTSLHMRAEDYSDYVSLQNKIRSGKIE